MRPYLTGLAVVSAVGLLLVMPVQSAEQNEWVTMSGVPTTANLYAVTGVSRTRAWAAGERGTMLMWDGTSWTPQAMPDPNAGQAPQLAQLPGTFINDIVMFNDNAGWAVGHHLHTTGRIFRWDGRTWLLHTKLKAADSNLVNAAFLSPTDGLAVASSGRVYRLKGDVWSVELGSEPLIGGLDIRNITRIEDVDAVPAMGSYVMAAISKPDVVSPGQYEYEPEADSIVWLDKPSFANSRRTPGDRATSDISELFHLPNGTLYYLSSHKNILRIFDTKQKAFTSWTHTLQVTHGVRNYWMLSEGEGWFIGHGGLVSHLSIGPRGLANSNTYPTNQRLTDIWMLDKDFGFIVGDNGTILMLNRPPALTLRPRAEVFRHRGNVFLVLENKGGALVAQQDGHWDIADASGTRVKRIWIPAASIATSLTAGRSLELGWNQVDDQGKPVTWGTYSCTVRIGSYQAKAEFRIETPPSDTPDMVGANAGLVLTAEPTYAPNAAVGFRIQNIGSTAVDVSEATYSIERHVNGNWWPFYTSTASFLGTQTLTPAASRNWSWNRRNSSGNTVAPAGKYRLVVTVPRATTDLNTSEFTLQ